MQRTAAHQSLAQAIYALYKHLPPADQVRIARKFRAMKARSLKLGDGIRHPVK